MQAVGGDNRKTIKEMKNTIILIGPINLGHVPATGDTMKNQLFIKRFSEVFDRVITIDTFNWKKRPWVVIQIVLTLVFHKNDSKVLSSNPSNAETIIRMLHLLHLDKKLFYWVVGGSFHKRVESGVYNKNNYKYLKAIIVQGKEMVTTLERCGLKNAIYLPNSKYVDFKCKKIEQLKDDKRHFVFLSRIEKYKGCDDIFEAIEILCKKGYEGRFDVTFYGKNTDELGYFKSFLDKVSKHRDVTYSGLLNLKDNVNYGVLSNHDVMLFPTFWEGEGFPGVIIDAYIAGLCIIATNWNLNKDVVEENYTGWLIGPHDVDALAEKMAFAIDNPDVVLKMRNNSAQQASKFDTRTVLSKDVLKSLELL